MKIAIVDTGGANLASIQNALARLGHSSTVTHDSDVIRSSSHLVLPGVGHARYAMTNLKQYKLGDVIREAKQPVLGICLGMQLLFEKTEEGDVDCLGVVPGCVKLLQPNSDFRVPHMGWNQLVSRGGSSSRLLLGIPEDACFYFVHSYAVPGGEWITHLSAPPHSLPAILEWRNFSATQFHPERSGDVGSKLLENFLRQEAHS